MTQPYNGNPESYRHLWEEGYNFDLGLYLNESWEIFKKDSGGFVGFFVLAYIIAAFASIIPLLGALLYPALFAVLTAGVYIVSDKIANGQSHAFDNFFRGFDDFLQIGISQIVMLLIIVIPALLLIIPFIAVGFQIDSIPELDPSLIALIVVGMIVLYAGIIYISICYTFSVPLIVFGRLEFWPALETSRKIINKRWWSFFLMFLLFFALNLVGLLALCLGILVTAPLCYIITYTAYRHITRDAETMMKSKIDDLGVETREIKDFNDL